ncbi:MAG: hypothetical protein HKP52_03310 [Desulfofustis sp.]|nr:hypothetical protein [Desulfofustis sp.]
MAVDHTFFYALYYSESNNLRTGQGRDLVEGKLLSHAFSQEAGVGIVGIVQNASGDMKANKKVKRNI